MKVVVLGAGGGLGRNVVDAALARGHEVTAMVRDRNRVALPAGTRVVTGDARRVDEVVAATEGADAAMFCVNPPWASWLDAFPPLVDTAIAAAQRTGARLVFPANVWVYGRGRDGELIDEARPVAPTSTRGRLRAELEHRIADGQIRYAMVRLPEFYGPHVVTLTARVVRAALDGKRAVWPGKLDAPIELVYMPDGAAAMVEVGTAADAERKTFHVPGVRTTARGFAAAVYAAAGAGKPRVSSVPPWILRAVGIFDAGVRGAADIGHLWTHPVLLDGARYAARFGAVPVTPLEDGVAATVAWMRDAGAVRLQG